MNRKESQSRAGTWRSLTLYLLLAVLQILFIPMVGTVAHAHTSLIESYPDGGSTLSEFPSRIELRFNESLLTIGGNKSNYLELFSPNGQSVGLSPSSVVGPMIVATRLPPETAPEIAPETAPEFVPGSYQIRYRVVAGDGHVIKGEIAFEFRPHSEASNGETNSGEESVIATPSPTAKPTEEEKPGDQRSVLILTGLILLTGATTVALLLRAR